MSGKPRKGFDGIARPQGFIDDTAKAAVNLVKGKVFIFKQNKLANKYAKERVVIQKKYDIEILAEKAKRNALKEKGEAAMRRGAKVTKEDWQKLQARTQRKNANG